MSFVVSVLVVLVGCSNPLGDARDSVDGADDSRDGDGDGYESWADCNDRSVETHPGAPELLNGIDDDCDEVVDEGTVAFDDDGDGASEQEGDCDDADFDVHPGSAESPNERDDDCDGVVDEDTVNFDDDGDGWTERDGDCDDTRAVRYPSAGELANGLDDDCDGVVDEGTVNFDDDGDAWAEVDGDCDDADVDVNPGINELDFTINRLTIIYEPTDFQDDQWDWDGDVVDFYTDNAAWIDLLAAYASNGAYSPELVETLLPYLEGGLQSLLSPYVTPDVTLVPFVWDGTDWTEYAPIENYDDTTFVDLYDLPLSFRTADDQLSFDGYDRDVAFDDPMGTIGITVRDLRYVAGCGPMGFVLTDAEMDAYETRVRAIELDVERR